MFSGWQTPVEGSEGWAPFLPSIDGVSSTPSLFSRPFPPQCQTHSKASSTFYWQNKKKGFFSATEAQNTNRDHSKVH